jgi:hypothetical protein
VKRSEVKSEEELNTTGDNEIQFTGNRVQEQTLSLS